MATRNIVPRVTEEGQIGTSSKNWLTAFFKTINVLGELILKHITKPANPSSGYVKLYVKNDDKIYKLDSAGSEVEVGASHVQGTDQGLDTGGPNAVTAAQAKAGYIHSGVTSGNPHSVTASDVGLGSVPNLDPRTSGFSLFIDGGGAAIATGVVGWIEVPFACTITAVRLLADVSGAIKIDIWKDTYANYPPTDADTITGGNEPEIAASGTKDEDSTLTSWTKTLAEGNILYFNVDSCATITKCLISLTVTRT